MKERNVVIVLPPGATAGDAVPGSKIGRYIKIPMPYGWNFFATLANQAVDIWRHAHDAKRGATPVDATLRAVTSFLGAYAPVSDLARSVESPKSVLLAPVPDFLNPVAQSLLNVNSFGKPMYPDDPRSQHMPDSSRFFPGQAGTAFQRSAKALNEATGGSRYRPGALDLTPATIENLVRGFGGGPASFTLDLMNAAYLRQSIQRPDLEARRLPFIKQLYGQIDAETDRVVGYERMDKIAKASDPFERALREGHRAEARDLLEAFGPIVRMGDFVREQRSVLADIRKQELAIIDSSQSDTMKFFRLQSLDAKKRKVLQRVNVVYGRALDKQQRAEETARVPVQ